MIAHVGGLPVEEALPALMSGGGAWLILRLTSLGGRLAVWSGKSAARKTTVLHQLLQ